MDLYFHHVILMAICLTLSTGHNLLKKECIDLIASSEKSSADQNKTNCLPENLKENNSSTQLQSELQLKADISAYFANKEMDLTVLNISFNNDEQSIDILKATTISNGDTNNIINKQITFEDETVKYDEHVRNSTTSVNTTNVGNLTSHEHKAEEKPQFSMAPVPNFNNLFTNNKNVIDILKAATTGSTEDKKDIPVAERQDKKSTDIQCRENFTATFKTNNSSNQMNTTTEIPFTGISLSEITNLSLYEEENLTVGQKIEFQRSNINSETEATNTAGMEILKNTSKICGSQFGKRISFANETTLMEYPWTALLIYNTKIRYHCGGSLITEKYVLTAAHCVAQQFYELIGVRLGEHDISEAVDCAPDLAGDKICATTTDVEVTKIIVHHEYSHRSFKNDIALLRLDKAYLGRSYYPICIPMPDMTYGNTIATVAGWGATEKAIRSTVLLKADVPIFDISKCREIYRYSVFNDSTEICGSGANEVDVCKGDSGGALFYSTYMKGKNKYYQLGIVSLGVRRCGDSRFLPAVFTKLNAFYKWIENNLEY